MYIKAIKFILLCLLKSLQSVIVFPTCQYLDFPCNSCQTEINLKTSSSSHINRHLEAAQVSTKWSNVEEESIRQY